MNEPRRCGPSPHDSRHPRHARRAVRRAFSVASVFAGTLAAAVFATSACVGYLDADAGAPTKPPEAGPPLDGASEAASVDGGVLADAALDDGGCGGSAYACAVLADRPLVYLRFDEATGAMTAHDFSGHGLDGTYPIAGVTLGAPGAIASEPSDHAASFGGSGPQQIAMPDSADFSGTPFSVELWILPDDPTPLTFVLDHETFGPTRGGWSLDFQNADIELELFVADQSMLVVPSINHALAAGAWHHVVASYDASNGQGFVWVDGVLANAQRSIDQPLPKVGAWSIGKQNCSPCTGSELKGSLDELAVYDHVLTEAVVKRHLAAARP